MWPTTAVIAASALAFLCVVLVFACWRLARAADHRGLQEWAFGLERDLARGNELVRQQLEVLAQVGELLEHAGVALERTLYQRESVDLKVLGDLLRNLTRPWEGLEPESAQRMLRKLGDRYYVEPGSGGLYSIRNAIRMAEEIIVERLLPVHQADNIGDALRTMRKWGFSVVEDVESARQTEADRLRRAEVVAVELLGPEARGSALAGRLAQALVQAAGATRHLSQFAASGV